MISEIYLKQALKIRKDYLKIVNDISRYENLAKDFISTLEERASEAQELYQKIDTNQITNSEVAKKELHELMIQTESDINKVDKSISDLNSQIEKLRIDEVNLFKEIKRVYFNLTDEQIREETQSYIKRHDIKATN
jgi:uncharacterized phage infection (PIP) family protein YhgE